jgi:L-threonylcarbamoyladenylate synthase
LRPGGVPVEELENLIGPVELAASSSDPGARGEPSPAQSAPGMLPQHYAPRTPLVLDSPHLRVAPALRVGLLAFQHVPRGPAFESVETLSESGDLHEAAANFFSALRRLDARDLDLIVAQEFPEQGLGRALNDRLRRAVHTTRAAED